MSDPFVRNPCRYPDEVRARAPRGLRDRLRQAADAERITMGEFVRRAVSERIEAVSRDDDGPGPFAPATGLRVAA